MRVAWSDEVKGEWVSGTAGVMVRDGEGSEYVTCSVSAGGFPAAGGREVYHPCPGEENLIGHLVAKEELVSTGIKLVKLLPHIMFVNETFASPLASSIKLRNFVAREKIRNGELLFLNSSDSGGLEGTLRIEARQRILRQDRPSSDSKEPQVPRPQWHKMLYVYVGQDSLKCLSDGIRGSAVYDENEAVFGFVEHVLRGGVVKLGRLHCG